MVVVQRKKQCWLHTMAVVISVGSTHAKRHTHKRTAAATLPARSKAQQPRRQHKVTHRRMGPCTPGWAGWAQQQAPPHTLPAKSSGLHPQVLQCLAAA